MDVTWLRAVFHYQGPIWDTGTTSTEQNSTMMPSTAQHANMPMQPTASRARSLAFDRALAARSRRLMGSIVGPLSLSQPLGVITLVKRL